MPDERYQLEPVNASPRYPLYKGRRHHPFIIHISLCKT